MGETEEQRQTRLVNFMQEKRLPPITTPQLREKLAAKYKEPAYAFLQEVRNSTGFVGNVRSADAIAMSLWPSRGLDLIGFELKISRSDWLHELNKPQKADEIAPYCDYWWVVVADESIVLEGELPPTWGLMAASGRGRSLRIIKDAPKLEAKELSRGLLASLLRNATSGTVPSSILSGMLKDERNRAMEMCNDKIERANKERDQIKQHIEDFEQASGLRINGWVGGKELGNIVKLVRNDLENYKAELVGLADRAQNIAEAIRSKM